MNKDDIVRDNKARWDVLNPHESGAKTFVWVAIAAIVGILALYLLI